MTTTATAPAPQADSPLGSLIRLAVVLAAVVALFIVAGLGDLLIVVGVILVMVALHEFGHFATAKWSKMKVTEAFIGIGPALWSIQRGETRYGIKAFPVAAYVKIPGMSQLEEVDPADEERTFRRQPFHKRIIVASAGSAMHVVLALVLAYIAVLSFGVPSNLGQIESVAHWGNELSPAARGGLRAGDIVEAVDGHRVDASGFATAIHNAIGRTLHVTVDRDGSLKVLNITPVDAAKVRVHGKLVEPTAGHSGIIGIEFNSANTSEGPVRAIGTSAVDLGRDISLTFGGLSQTFSASGLDNYFHQVTNSHAATKSAATGDRPQSIVGIVRTTTQAEQAGILYLIELLVAINVIFAIVNMVPMLPLDGGHVAIAVYERIRTRRGQPYYQADITKLLPVVYAFVVVLVVFVGSAAYLDITHPISNPFG